ncbi:MAG: sulfotransferase domain-containing protein [Hyphomicrobiaceae bacterium]
MVANDIQLIEPIIMTATPPRRVYRTWVADSRRWDGFQPRQGDIVIATYPKSGTTWMQQIVSLLIHQSAVPRTLPHQAAWLEMRHLTTHAQALAAIEEEPSPRSIKCHMPFDGIPVFDAIKYIHVARDGRDACMSYHNHCLAFTPAALARQDAAGLADPWLGRPAPRASPDPRKFYRDWMGQGSMPGEPDGLPFLSYFNFERTYWEARHRPNMLLVHYNDLKADLDGEMRRVAAFLGFDVTPTLWPSLVEAASFEAMKAAGNVLLPHAGHIWEGGADRFLHKGTNNRWRDVLTTADIELYEARVHATLPTDCAQWLAGGRHAAEAL